MSVNELREPAMSQDRSPRGSRPVWSQLWFWVFVAIATGVALGAGDPALAVQMAPLGTVFIKLVTLFIGPLIFCTMVSGMARLADANRIGTLAAKTLLVFGVMTAFSMLVGFLSVDLLHPGIGLDLPPAGAGANATGHAATPPRETTQPMQFVPFLVDIVPKSFVGAFVQGNMLQVLFVAILSGVAIITLGERAAPVSTLLDAALEVIFRAIRMVMLTAPLGAFGAIAAAVGKYGLASMLPLARFIIEFGLTCVVILAAVAVLVASLCRFNLLSFIRYFRDEILICVATTSSEAILPRLIEKLERMGCERSIAGLVLPAGHSFNPTGTSVYLVMVICFLAQAVGKPLPVAQQLELFVVLNLTARSTAGVAGSAFVVLVGTVGAWGPVPVAATGLILGIHRLLAQCFVPVAAFTNVMAALAVAQWEKALDRNKLVAVLGRRSKYQA